MKPHLIGIAGPSCAGKGEVANWLISHLSGRILDLDAYYREQRHIPFEERRLMNYDVPSALDTGLLFEQVARIAEGETVSKPCYDFALHTRADVAIPFSPAPYVIIEGLFTLHWPELREMLDTKIFIDAPDAECLRRRIARDTTQRGREESDVIRQFNEQVLPAAIHHVRPTAKFADLILDGRIPWEENGDRAVRLLKDSTRATRRASAGAVGP